MTPRRDRLQEELKRRGIPTAVHYPIPLQQQPAYARYGDGALPVSESVAAQVISLPMYADMAQQIIEKIASKVLAGT
jgi:UDP-2-acetamido-2-deoxy-ribo-hexuluronate aminotransferase